MRNLTCGVLLLLSASALGSEPDYEALYLQRFEILKANGGIMPQYSPTEVVTGALAYQPLPVASASEQSISSVGLKQAADYAAKNNSAAFMVWQNGKVQQANYFGDNTAVTPLVSKSLSKPLSAIAIGRAIQLGAIRSLDQPVAEFITEWQGTPKSAVLVRHLLDMRSGFLAQGFSLSPDHPWNRAYLSYEHEKVLINDYPLTDEPGVGYSYNNATADMVAIVIERATGQRYAEFIGQEVLAKIGAQGGDIWVGREGGLAHSGCCMHLPAESWLRLGILLLQQGEFAGQQLLSPAIVQALITPTAENPHFALGIWVGQPYAERRGYTGVGGGGPQIYHSAPYRDPGLYLFDGNSSQVVYMLPAYNMVVLRLGASPPKDPEWDNSYLPNLLVDSLK